MEQQKYGVGAFFWTQFLVTEIAAAPLSTTFKSKRSTTLKIKPALEHRPGRDSSRRFASELENKLHVNSNFTPMRSAGETANTKCVDQLVGRTRRATTLANENDVGERYRWQHSVRD